MDKGKIVTRDRLIKMKPKKNTQTVDPHDSDSRECSRANASYNPPANANEEEETDEEVSLNTILAEIKSFRQDNKQQLGEIKDEICKAKLRLDEVEERIVNAEERIQSMEGVMEELVKLQSHLEAKQSDQEGRSRRNNIRIYSIAEGSEKESPSMIHFVEELLKHNLSLANDKDLQIERAHRALGSAPPEGAPPRSIVVSFQSYRIKEEILRAAWQKRGFVWKNAQVNLDNDYAPSVLKKRQEYAEAKKVLKEHGIRFQTPFPARLRVFYPDGTRIYNSAEDATREMAEKGLQVTALKPPESLLEQIRRLSWTISGGRRQTQSRKQRGPTYKDRLQKFSWEPVQNDQNEAE